MLLPEHCLKVDECFKGRNNWGSSHFHILSIYVLTNLEHGAASSVKVLNAYNVDNYPEFDTNGMIVNLFTQSLPFP